MTDFAALLNALRRPKILIRAARAGLADHRRDRDQKRSAPRRSAPGRRSAPARRGGRARGDPDLGRGHLLIPRHVAVLTALLAEVRLLPQTAPQA